MGTLNYKLPTPQTPSSYITGGTPVNPITNTEKTGNTNTSTTNNNITITETDTPIDLKRGKIGTITTSWAGFLGKDEKLPKRKTLLGE